MDVKNNNNSGFTLIEVIVSLAIITLLMLGLHALIILSLKVTDDNAYIVEATEIVNQRMERIRNMRYDDVGTITGSPHGIIDEYETVNRNGIFEVHTMVIFYDDPYDGTIASGTDNIFVDYKIVTIDVNWQGRYGPKKISVFSKIVPNTEETLSGYGLLKLITVNASGAIVPNATIHIENSSPVLSADYVSDSNGQFNIALLPDFEGYQVVASKIGYATEKTYARDAVNLNPTKVNLSIFEGVKTEESFSIDQLANFHIRTVTDNLPENWRVNASTSFESISPDASLDQNDNVYFVWQENGLATSTVKLQKYNSFNVRGWTDDVIISTSSFQMNPDIATTKSGISYVVWQDDSVSLKSLAYDTGGYLRKIAKSSPAYYQIKQIIPKKISFFSKIASFFRNVLFFGKHEINTKNAQALSNVNIVQTKISSFVGGDNWITTSFDNPPTVGNVLLAIATHRNTAKTFNAPTNAAGTFSVARYSNSSWALDTGIWYKIAGASELNSVTITSSGDINGGVLMLMEISGLDTTSLLNVTSANDQTGSSLLVAHTETTNVSADDAFAIAAVAFADNDFNTPGSANWSSLSSDTWAHRLWADWSTGNDGSLAIASMVINSAAAQRATLTLTGGGNEERNSVLVVFKALSIDQGIVSVTGNQNASLVMPQMNYYTGGKFVITEAGASRDVNSVKLQEHGSVDAQDAISAVKLFYDIDTTYPYDCASENYDSAVDSQFGTNAVFDSADGFATITHTGGINITTIKTLCLYPVLDIVGANNNDTLDIKINNPSIDIIVSSGTVVPSVPVEINGDTLLITPADIRQVHARLRNDDGGENNATWRNIEDAAGTMYMEENIRIRFEIANKGGTSSPDMAYRLEFGELISNCDNISTWQEMPTDNSLAWKITDSSYITEPVFTANIANGLTDENAAFLAGEIKDLNNETNLIKLNFSDFTEIEFSIKPNISAGNKSFCFRLTDQGNSSAITYEKYAIVSIKGDENIFVRAINDSGNFSWFAKRVNSDTGNSHQVNPVIVLTENFGAATSAVAWEDDRNGNSDIYLQILDEYGLRQFSSDLQISTSSAHDYSPDLAFDAVDGLYVAWTKYDTSRDIYLSKFDFGGNLLLGPIALKNSSNEEYFPKIAFDDSGNLYLSYTEEISGIKKIVIAKYDALLFQLWEKNPNIDGMTYNQFSGNLGIYNSAIYVIWNDDRNGNKDIFSQKLDSSGDPLWTSDVKINIGLDYADQIDPKLLVRSSLQAIGIWSDERDGRNEIYASEFSDPAALVGAANIPLQIVGTKRIGEDPVIYKHNEIHTTDSNGNLDFELDWDVPGYSVSIYAASSSKNIILRDPPQPLNFSPLDNKLMTIYVQ
jgi:prepilin-type N-terminal cleavage/methylation domain-containing protein